MKHLISVLLVLTITGCNSPTEKSVSEQPQVVEDTPEPAPMQTQTPTPSADNCDRAYPDVCIPPAPPDLDCKDVPHQNFRVLPPDPHKFDRDKDGIGCESR
jgi:micrococcal nuclease